MKISKTELDLFDNSRLDIIAKDMYFPSYPGEHYRLLSYLSNQFENSEISDVGTYRGMSALACSYNPTNKVKSYDVEYKLEANINYPETIEFILDSWEPHQEEIFRSSLILFDTNHLGTQEKLFMECVKNKKYEGYILFDDIYLNRIMQEFWESITQEKYDLTSLGHSSGTGLVVFNKEIEILI